MALVLWLSAVLVPGLIGMGTLRILYGSQRTQDLSPADWILTGGMIVIGLAEGAHLGAVILGWSFSYCVKVFGTAVGVSAAAAGVLEIWGGRRGDSKACGKAGSRFPELRWMRPAGQLPWLFFMALVLGLLIYVATRRGVYVDGDLTLETVQSFLHSDRVHQVNPMTGQGYTLGMPLRLKILCLPTLYGALATLTGLDAEQLIYGMIPAFVLLGSFLAYYALARQFFPADSWKRGVFMAFAALLLGAGDYLYGMDGFGLLHSGFRGVAIRSGILLPYTFGVMLRKKYKLALLCILAEACIVWTLYGLGACALAVMGLAATELLHRRIDKYRGGKEDSHVETPG